MLFSYYGDIVRPRDAELNILVTLKKINTSFEKNIINIYDIVYPIDNHILCISLFILMWYHKWLIWI